MGRSPIKHPAAVEMGLRMRVRRKALNLSQEKVAERCGYHPTYISSVERGERNVSLMAILRLAEALEMDPGNLLKGLRT